MYENNNRETRLSALSGATESQSPAGREPQSKPIAHEPLSTGHLPSEEGAGERQASETAHRRADTTPHKAAAMKKRKENGRHRSEGYQGL